MITAPRSTWRRCLGSIGLSLTLAATVASVLMCVRSHYATDAWECRIARTIDGGRVAIRSFTAWCGFGSLVLCTDGSPFYTHQEPPAWAFRWTRHPAAAGAEGLAPLEPVKLPLGFAYARHTVGAASSAVVVPIWMIVMTFTLPAAWIVRRSYVRWRRGRAGLCTSCGYDIRASGETCPECGAAILATSDG